MLNLEQYSSRAMSSKVKQQQQRRRRGGDPTGQVETLTSSSSSTTTAAGGTTTTTTMGRMGDLVPRVKLPVSVLSLSLPEPPSNQGIRHLVGFSLQDPLGLRF